MVDLEKESQHAPIPIGLPTSTTDDPKQVSLLKWLVDSFHGRHARKKPLPFRLQKLSTWRSLIVAAK
jgi:hypothetical protein